MTDLQPGTFSFQPVNEWPFSPKFQDFADFLGLSPDRDAKGVNWRYDKKTSDKMQQIYTWGMVKAKSVDHDQIKEAVYSLQKKVGLNWVGKILVDRLWQHTTFDAQYKKEVAKLYKQIETTEKKETKEEVKPQVERPEKLAPAESKPMKKIKQTEQSLKNTMDIPEVKYKPAESQLI